MRLVAGVCALVVVLAACGSSDPGAAKTVMPDVVGKKLDVAETRETLSRLMAGGEVAAREPGQGGLPALEPAPGSYVKIES